MIDNNTKPTGETDSARCTAVNGAHCLLLLQTGNLFMFKPDPMHSIMYLQSALGGASRAEGETEVKAGVEGEGGSGVKREGEAGVEIDVEVKIEAEVEVQRK